MGLLLAFMFLWNMLGALVLLPALSHWLLQHLVQPLVQAQAPARAADAPSVAVQTGMLHSAPHGA
jgi:hypothetical protein